MLQGLVRPPSCCLDAAILKRQLLAFSLERWVESGVDPMALPRQLKPVLNAVENAGDAIPEAWVSLNSDISVPFPRPSTGRIAVKVINHLGDEVMKVYRV